MHGSCLLATSLDILFLQHRRVDQTPDIWPEGHLSDMPVRTGADVAAELAGRKLLRLTTNQHEGPRAGMKTWLTPTAICPECAGQMLHLPNELAQREWAILIEPSLVEELQGPRRPIMGVGIEYYLPKGYGEDAMVHYGVHLGSGTP